MELIATHRTTAAELNRTNARLIADCSLPAQARNETTKAKVAIQTALALLSVAEENARHAGINESMPLAPEAITDAYIQSAETVIESAEILLFNATTGIALASVGREKIASGEAASACATH